MNAVKSPAGVITQDGPEAVKRITLVGSVVEDLVYQPGDIHLGRGAATGKRTGEFIERVGGAPANINRQLQNSGSRHHRTLIPILGDCRRGAVLSAELAEEFREIRPVYAGAYRRSLITTETTFCNRPVVGLPQLPERVHGPIRNADLLFVGPFAAEDNPLVVHTLRMNPRSVLQLSREQLESPIALDLVNLAQLCAVNAAEFDLLAGTGSDLESRMYSVFQQTGTNLLVSGNEEIHLLLEGKIHRQFCFDPHGGRNTSGAGDVLLATVAEAMLDGLGGSQALYLGALASCRHVAGLPAAGRGRLIRWGETQRALNPGRHVAATA